MRDSRNLAGTPHIPKGMRRALEYAVALGIALLSAYWIVQGHW